MSLPRFLIADSLPKGEEDVSILSLSPSEAHHIRVLRIREGEHVILCDARACAAEFIFCALEGERLSARFVQPVTLPYLPRLTLVQGISKGDRMETTIRQATELGIEAFVPLRVERCIVRFDEAKAAAKAERWRRIARSAAEQSGSLSVPWIADPLSLGEALELLAGYDALVCAWEESTDGSIGEALREALPATCVDPEVALFVGPEGGFTAHEVETMRAARAHVISLGDTILRTETAGVVGSALVSYELGGLGNISSPYRAKTAKPVA